VFQCGTWAPSQRSSSGFPSTHRAGGRWANHRQMKSVGPALMALRGKSRVRAISSHSATCHPRLRNPKQRKSARGVVVHIQAAVPQRLALAQCPTTGPVPPANCTADMPVSGRCDNGPVPVWSPWGAVPIGTTPGHNRVDTVPTPVNRADAAARAYDRRRVCHLKSLWLRSLRGNLRCFIAHSAVRSVSPRLGWGAWSSR